MKLKIKIIGTIISLVCLILVGYSTAYGILLPYSPVIVGFEKKTYKMATIYYHKGYNLPPLEEIDTLIEENESTHDLKYKRNVDIILCESDREKKRITGSLTRAQSFFLFGRVVVSRKLQDEAVAHEKPFGMYLQHELSHSLTHQNLSLLRTFTFPAWLDEGLAVYSSDQFGKAGYFNQQEVSAYLSKGFFYHPNWWPQPLHKAPIESKEFELKNKYYFIYSEYGCIVSDLINTYGRNRFIDYYHHLLKNKENEKIFQSSFGISFYDYLDEFKKRMISKSS
nr:hypothetical protein [uncultured Desulfobacter sp.]